jgi:hypothetical protein
MLNFNKLILWILIFLPSLYCYADSTFISDEIIIKLKHGVIYDHSQFKSNKTGISSIDKLNRTFKIKHIKNVFNFIDNLNSDEKPLAKYSKKRVHSLKKRGDVYKSRDLDKIFLMKYENENIDKIINRFRRCKDVEFADKNHVLKLLGYFNDPYSDYQFYLKNIGQDYYT